MVFLGLFALAAAVHIIAICLDKNIPRALSKVCLLPLLLGFYILRAEHFLVPAALALFLGWTGDIFLLSINYKQFFKLGLGSFLLGHLCYILSMIFFTENFNIPALIIATAAALALGIPVMMLIKPDRTMRVPVIVYGIVIELMGIFALALMLSRRAPPGIAAFAGSLCFLFSDSVLAYFTFRTLPRYGNLLVMIPYMAAQLCLTLALAYC
jgi:uncharacterized membrane protein YhhN